MPIKPENQRRYPLDWREISLRVRFGRAKGRCECTGQCGLHVGRRCLERHGRDAKWARGKIVLTVAHLDHQPENSHESNLLAMCQRCHLRYDSDHHARTARLSRQEQRASGTGCLFETGGGS